jgi:uroporphyrin-III C-methyltransferase/precorrin-2 dehydrogenase/sirohydrochlorin ferrochelatase
MDPYLLGLRLGGRRVVVVGGGAVATRRIPALLDAGADVVLVSPTVTASLEDLAAAGRIRWEPRRYAAGDCAGAWLVCACTDDAATNAAVAAEAERQRTWYVRADDAQASAAWTPATGRAEDVRADGIQSAAVQAGPVQAGPVQGRPVQAGHVQGGPVQGRPVQRGAVQVGVLSGDPRHSAAIRDAILGGLRTGQLSGRHGRGHRAGVAIIGGGPGDPGLITVRGRQLLAEADVVLTDRLAPRSLLDELPADVEVIDVSKIPYGRAMAQEQINATLIDRARAGRFVARLKGGDPFVFGRGAEEVLACLRAGVSPWCRG